MTAVWLVAVLPLLPLLLTAFNLAVWRRPRPRRSDPGVGPRVSVLIPARNEERGIAQAVRSVLESPDQVLEVVVYDDLSTDGTAEVVRALAAQDSRVRLIDGVTLPTGWVGKPHACHNLAARARGDVLLFVDADVRLRPFAVGGLVQLLDAPTEGRVVSAVPEQHAVGFFERLVLPLLVVTYLAWLPLNLVERGNKPSTVAANGQILLLRRSDLERLGGFTHVRSEIVDDVAFCRLAKVSGLRVIFADGFCLATCRMYESAGQVWRGFSKNIFEGLGSNGLVLLMVLGLYLGCWVAPYVALAAGILGSTGWLVAGACGVAASVCLRALLAVRFRQPLEGILLHPVAVLALCAIALNSLLWHRQGRIAWAGRSYARKGERSSLLPVPRSEP